MKPTGYLTDLQNATSLVGVVCAVCKTTLRWAWWRRDNLLTAFLLAVLLGPGPTFASLDDYPAGSRIAWVQDLTQALDRGRREGKPIFVYFHAQWCTWCRTYQAETLEQAAVVGLLNRRFVPTLVHADRRRDLFQRYGGRGLPYTVVLEPGGSLRFRFTGQLDPEALLDVLLRPPRPTDAAQGLASGPFDRALFDTWLEELYDPASRRFLNASHLGGTGKRWQPLSLIYLLDHPAWRSRLPGLYAALLEDLEDPVDGGFFFFADRTREDARNPVETSKVLAQNALVIWSLIEAYERLGDPRLAQPARRGLAWIERRLWDAREGGFFGSQFSDADYHARDAAGRRQLTPPPLERIKYADANALAALAFARAAAVLGEPRYLAVARRTLAFMEAHLRAPDGGYFHYREARQNRLPGYLPGVLWAIAAHAEVQRLAPSPGGQAVLRRLIIQLERYRDPQGGLWERLPTRERQTWKTAASQGLYAFLVATLPPAQVPSAHRRWASQALARLPAPTEPDDAALAMHALRRLPPGTGG